MTERNFNRHTGDTSCACQITWVLDARSVGSVIDLAAIAAAAPLPVNPYTQLFAEGDFYAMCLDEHPFGPCTIQCAQPRGHEGQHRFDCHVWEQQ